MIDDPIGRVLQRLNGVKASGNGWQAQCPAHDDRDPSLRIARGNDGRVLLHCYAGCSVGAICAALGVEERELFPHTGHPPPVKAVPPRHDASKRTHPTRDDAIRAAARTVNGKPVDHWRYDRSDGTEAFRVVRFDTPKGKQYRPVHWDGDSWRIGDPPGPLPLYRLPKLSGTEVVFVTEGEKAADAVGAIGLVATTSAHGAGSAKKSDWTPLGGRQVVILPDNDEPGERYAGEVATILSRLHPPARIKILRLPDLPAHGDAMEYVEACRIKGLDDGAIRTMIHRLAERAPAGELPGPKPRLIRLADVKPEPVRWLWPGRIPLGKLTLFAGDPGLGKSMVALDIAARVSRGTPWPDARDQSNALGSVIILSAEDDPADTIRPRLDAAGADVGGIHVLATVQQADGTPTPFLLERDVPVLERALRQVGGCRLVVIDPVTAYLGGTDSHKNADIRGLLAPLAELAGQYRVAVVAVTHLNKSYGGKALYRATGSLAFNAAARSSWLVVGDKDSPKRRLMLPVKSNLAPNPTGLAYTIESKEITGVGGVAYVAWEADPVEMTADEALAAETKDNRAGGSVRDVTADWLRELLAPGLMPSSEIKKQAEAAGISWATVRRAQTGLGIKPVKTAFDGPWFWGLPTEDAHQGAQDAQHSELSALGESEHLREREVVEL